MQTTVHLVPKQLLYQETRSILETGNLLCDETRLHATLIEQALSEAE